MKKLALIILIALYGLAITGAGIAPVMAGVNGLCTHAEEFTTVKNGDEAGRCGSETCNTGYTAFTVKEHQHAGRQFNCSDRYSLKHTEGNLPIAASFIQPGRLFSANTPIPVTTVPAYILHCVYRL